jgi:hypothetical protein
MPRVPCVVGEVGAGTAAEKNGLLANDKIVGIDSWADLSIQQGPYVSPSITWGPIGNPSFKIYQFAGGSGSVIRAEGYDSAGYLYLQAVGRIELSAPEIISPYIDIQMPSAPTSLAYSARRGFRNIYAETALPSVSNFYDGDIVLVY